MSAGKGIKLEGLPTDIRRFYRILADEGCHPKATRRIIYRIRDKGFDLLTVMERLNFDWIRRELGKVGVKMTFIEPLDHWSDKYRDGVFPEWALPDRLRKSNK